MRKLIVLILTLVSMLGLVSCHVNNAPYWDLSSATRIEIEIFDTQTSGDSITVVAIEEQKDIDNIISNLNSLELEKIEYNEPTVALYTLMFYNSENDHIESITISIDGWLTCEGYFHYVKSGNLDLDYLEQIVSERIDSKPTE